MRKKRGYKREIPENLLRDYKLFAIACEGQKREPEYFKTFRFLSRRIAVDVIEDVVSEEEALSINPNKSAPKWVLDRAVRYIEKEGLNNEDDLWFVMDIDRWEPSQILEIATLCDQYPNWHIVLSNPCFEVWLYLHKESNISKSKSKECSDFKSEISQFEKGGYHPIKFIPFLPDAIVNAKALDSKPAYYLPEFKTSKVYQLGESVLRVVGKKGFDDFIKITLPKLVEVEKEKSRKSSKSK